MNTAVKLPSGTIVNLSRFIALLPVNSDQNTAYDLILEGSPVPINLQPSDAEVVKQILRLNENTPEWDVDKQIQKNQRAMALLRQMIERDKNISKEESLERQEFFEEFKRIIDAERSPGQKLYS